MCVVRLPLHLWTTEILKRIGENCGGFITIDKEVIGSSSFVLV